ncbi:hypothetical protein [Marininema halotolerans]|uniref:Uncharacterized protein n=1 Tax=Marininema halotolerans TaxID=1155944 RepID=A0A1I6TV11_9BACL|nr:hypothetical protein [Marininema halotolerans]SFS92827.1 hypothetical protein SAMN05444972_11182 [Marininema halotolerans]
MASITAKPNQMAARNSLISGVYQCRSGGMIGVYLLNNNLLAAGSGLGELTRVRRQQVNAVTYQAQAISRLYVGQLNTPRLRAQGTISTPVSITIVLQGKVPVLLFKSNFGTCIGLKIQSFPF